MYLLRCCGLCDQPIETNPTLENQPEILDEPVIIESLPDVATLQLAQPSELSEKLALPSVPAIVPIPIPTHWEVSKKTSPMKKLNTTSPFFASAEFGNASEEQIDMHNALDKRLSSREYILSITDDELSRFPVAFIESFYPDLSLGRPICVIGEIMQLEQRLCDLKTGISSSKQSSEPLSIESENFLKSYRSQITIHIDAGFQVSNKRSSQSGFDIRQLILSAQNRKIIPLDWEVVKQLQPFLSVIEFQNMAGKMGFHTFLQKQQLGLPLSNPTNSCTTSSYVQRAQALNRNIYHPTREPSVPANNSLCSEDIVKQSANGKLSPVIKITDTETENVEIHESNSPNE
ncbi:hypothetical protein X798_03055 [Onchocerca flexuosa]|uniref:Uncharacterized protein n=1 Tax=Onchocerca flexuosa TaxID=387005 RepID=A0A238BXG7_9BILA|nr:hypothetical protein X798_03055 [Onchocerca flexuosa]